MVKGQAKPRTGLSGGKREGAGRKSARVEAASADAYSRLVSAKAEREETNAARDLLKLRKEAGELCALGEVMQLYTTTIAIFVEQMRSLPDMLERKAGLSPRQAEMAADEIDEQLELLEKRLLDRFVDRDIGAGVSA